MNRRKFFSLVGAAAAAVSVPSLARSATPAPTALDQLWGDAVDITPTSITVLDWKEFNRHVILNEAWMARIESSAM